MYNRSGENDPNRGTWGSVEEQERWARNAMKQTSYPSAIVYSVAVLEEGDFEVMGRELPKGTGIENSILGDEGLTIGIKRSTPNHRRAYKKKAKTSADASGIAKALSTANRDERQLRALQLMLKYGTSQDKFQEMEL